MTKLDANEAGQCLASTLPKSAFAQREKDWDKRYLSKDYPWEEGFLSSSGSLSAKKTALWPGMESSKSAAFSMNEKFKPMFQSAIIINK